MNGHGPLQPCLAEFVASLGLSDHALATLVEQLATAEIVWRRPSSSRLPSGATWASRTRTRRVARGPRDKHHCAMNPSSTAAARPLAAAPSTAGGAAVVASAGAGGGAAAAGAAARPRRAARRAARTAAGDDAFGPPRAPLAARPLPRLRAGLGDRGERLERAHWRGVRRGARLTDNPPKPELFDGARDPREAGQGCRRRRLPTAVRNSLLEWGRSGWSSAAGGGRR